jgi:hypothetical protein
MPEQAPRIVDLPYRPNPFFTGRDDDLVRIHQDLHGAPTAVLTQVQVRALAAMGGILARSVALVEVGDALLRRRLTTSGGSSPLTSEHTSCSPSGLRASPPVTGSGGRTPWPWLRRARSRSISIAAMVA